jgi:NADPH:quinone reductase-like Zn-dependent oxidoreductase
MNVITLLSLVGIMPMLATASALPATMRKVVLEEIPTGYQWKMTEAPVPVPGDHQVLIRVHAVGLNHGDLSRLKPSSDKGRAGRVPTSDAAGEVVAVGKYVKDVRKGERVVGLYFKNWADGPYAETLLDSVHGWTTDGMLAEYVALETAAVAPIPKGWSYEEAATLPTAGLTAWNALIGHHEVRPGEVVLVQGTGGVSTFALQFAVAQKARVIVTSSSDEKLLRAKSMGAKAGINYKREPAWSEQVLQLTNNHGADVVVDVGGANTLEQSVKSLANEGTLSIVGGLSSYDGTISAWGLLKRSAHAQGVFVGSRADYLRMSAFITKHAMRPVIERVYPLDQYADALQLLDSGNFIGKIVLRVP